MSRETIQVVLMCRDRIEYFKDAFKSILYQEESDIVGMKILVSDNSIGKDVENFLKDNYPNENYLYIRRNPPVSIMEHYQLIFNDIDEEYTIMFHDDDLMKPYFIKHISNYLPKNGIAAVSCNAVICKRVIKESGIKSFSDSDNILFNTKTEFFKRYLPGSSGQAPYPAYLYNSNYLKQTKFLPLPNGSCDDVAMISSMLDFGSILWLKNDLMYYRVHQNSNTEVEDIMERIILMRYMIKNGLDRSLDSIALFRCEYWARWICKQPLSELSQRKNKVVAIHLVKKLMFFLRKKIFWRVIFTRIFNFFKG